MCRRWQATRRWEIGFASFSNDEDLKKGRASQNHFYHENENVLLILFLRQITKYPATVFTALNNRLELFNGRCALCVMLPKNQWKPFWLATALPTEHDTYWVGWQFHVNYLVSGGLRLVSGGLRLVSGGSKE